MEKGEAGIKEIVEGVIQGEVRVLTANMDLNKLFKEREEFKNEVVHKIGVVLAPFGLTVYNANIAELADVDKENSYFEEQKKRALQEVNQSARVAVAHSIKDGEVGEKTHQAEARKLKIAIESAVVIQENQRKQEIAESQKNLAVAEAQYKKEIAIANAESKSGSERRAFELQIDVEKTRKEQETERRRATDLAAANVAAEILIKEAEGQAQAVRIKADADLYAKINEAKGNFESANAQAKGLEELIKAAGGADNLVKYLFVERHVLEKLAEQQAHAVKDMKPNINIWNGSGGSNSTVGETLTDLLKTSMPLFDGVKKQTGYDFLGSMGVKKD